MTCHADKAFSPAKKTSFLFVCFFTLHTFHLCSGAFIASPNQPNHDSIYPKPLDEYRIVLFICDQIFERHLPEVNLVATMSHFEVAKSYAQ